MSIDKQTVQKVAFLSRLKIEDNKIDATADEFNKILKWIEQLDEANTQGVEPLVSVNDIELVMRDDIVTQGNQAEQILQNAPASQYDCFVVNKFVE